MKKIFCVNIYALTLTVLLTSLVGCKSLEENPASFVTPENFYTSKAQVEAAFASSMNSLWSAWDGYSYGFGPFVNDDQIYGGDLNISISQGDGLWKAHYEALLNINNPISAIQKGNLRGADDATVKQLLAQAKFLRAYNYFMLVRMFGAVPLLTEETPNTAQLEVPRAPVKEVYALIVSDLTEAAANLPKTWPAAQKARPTSAAAKGLLAKVYLTMATAPLNDVSNYAKAADMALQVMQEGTYSLVPKVDEVFSLANKYGPEMMFSFNSSDDDLATDPQIWAPGVMGGWGDFSANPIWERKYPAGPRKAAYLITEYEGVPYTKWPGNEAAYIRKYLNISTDDFNSYRSTSNIPILRFADVLLIFAEAENGAKGAPTQAAVDAINKVIDRANGNVANPAHPKLTTALSKDAFDKAVIEERNQELCFEYDRWFDLVRKRMLKDVNPEWTANFSEDDYLFPIPESDLRMNALLEQNPGYPTPARN